MLQNIFINVQVDPGSNRFVATTQLESCEAPVFADAVNGLVAKVVSLHTQLQGLPDGDLSSDGIAFRDTGLDFTPAA